MQTPVHLGKLLLRLYEILGEDPPNHIRYQDPIDGGSLETVQRLFENESAYSPNLREALEANGWFRTRHAHPAWKNLDYNVANEIVLDLCIISLMDEWKLDIAFFAPWPPEWDASFKLGYLKGFNLDVKLEEIDLYWGRPVCFLRIMSQITEIILWDPGLLKEKPFGMLAKILNELPDGHLMSDPKRGRASGWYGYDAMDRITRAKERTWKESDPVYHATDRNCFHKVLTDETVYYVLYDGVRDQFESRLFDTPEEAVRHSMLLGHGDATFDQRLMWAQNSLIVHNLKRDNIHEAVRLCAELKCGKALTPEEARIVQGFHRFLDALIGHSEVGYPELDEHMSSLAGKLGTKPDQEWVDFTFYATAKVFGDTFRSEVRTKPSRKISTVNERKLAGRYLSRLAQIARIAGTDRLSAHEMIDKFRASEDDV